MAEKRRTKGDGGLTQRKDGRWQGSFLVTNDAGRKVRKYVYGRTKRETLHRLRAAIRDRDAGTLVMTQTTVEQWMGYWLDRIAARRLKPQTLREYRGKTRLYIVPQLGRHRLTTLRPEHVRNLYDWMRDDGRADGTGGLAEATVRQTHAILRKALGDAVKDGKVATNPVEKVDAPKTDRNRRRPLSAHDAHRVLAAAGEDARWWLALFYGKRQGEALGLRWCDVDFERHTLRVQQTLQTDENYRIIFGPPKGEASRNVVPLLPLLESRLRLAYLNAGEPDQRDRCDGVTGQCLHGLVFTDRGRPIWPNDDWAAWRDLLVRAAVPPLAPVPHVALHAARNTAASLLEAAGVPDRLVMQILGQSQVQITHGYQSADLERMRQAFEALGNVLELG